MHAFSTSVAFSVLESSNKIPSASVQTQQLLELSLGWRGKCCSVFLRIREVCLWHCQWLGNFYGIVKQSAFCFKRFSVNTIKMYTKPVMVCPSLRFHKIKSISESINCLKTGKIFGTGLDSLLSLTTSQWGSDKDTFPVAWSGFALRYCSLTLYESRILTKIVCDPPITGTIVCPLLSSIHLFITSCIHYFNWRPPSPGWGVGSPVQHAFPMSPAATGDSSDTSELISPWGL